MKASLEDLYNGRTIRLAISRNKPCTDCEGRGGKEGAEKTCTQCKGKHIYIDNQKYNQNKVNIEQTIYHEKLKYFQ